MRRYLTSILLWLTVIIGELHSCFAGIPGTFNWIWTRPTPMSLQWNVWFIAKDINYLLLLIAIRFWQANKHNIITLRVFTYFAVIDFFLYFYNHKTYEYGKVYLWMAATWFVLFYKKKIITYLWLKLEQLINPYR